MSILTDDKTVKQTRKKQQRMRALNRERRKVLFAINAAKFNCKRYTACYQSSARYSPEGLSSIKKYFGIHIALIDGLEYYSQKWLHIVFLLVRALVVNVVWIDLKAKMKGSLRPLLFWTGNALK